LTQLQKDQQAYCKYPLKVLKSTSGKYFIKRGPYV